MASPTKNDISATYIERLPTNNTKEHDASNANKITIEARDSRFGTYLALNKPSPFSKSLLALYPILFVACMNSAANGFDGNTFGGASAMPNFQQRFGTNVASSQGFLAALYVLGNVLGSFIAGPLADKFGRKWGMVFANIVIMVGSVVQAAASKRREMIVGRIILGVGSVMLGPSAQSYTVEISHPAYRGTMVGFYNGCYFVGAIISTWLEYGIEDDTKGELNWRLPMAMQMLPCIIVLAFVWFMPESPRWLMSRGRTSEARAILAKYHGEGDPSHEIVQIEMLEMESAIETAGTDKQWWNYKDLFSTKSNRHRMFLVMCVGFFGQLNLPPTSYYMPLMAQNAGITSTKQQLLMNALQSPIMMISTILGVRFIDIAGRRPMLMGSSTICTFCVIMVVICSALQDKNPHLGLTGISFVYVFLFAFAFVWTPMQALYPSEVLAYNSRAKGLAMGGLWLNIVAFIGTYAAPVGITRSHWKFYLLYLFVDFTGIIVIYFLFPETKGRSLEEINEIFEDPHPVKASLRKRNIVIDQIDGKVIAVEPM